MIGSIFQDKVWNNIFDPDHEEKRAISAWSERWFCSFCLSTSSYIRGFVALISWLCHLRESCQESWFTSTNEEDDLSEGSTVRPSVQLFPNWPFRHLYDGYFVLSLNVVKSTGKLVSGFPQLITVMLSFCQESLFNALLYFSDIFWNIYLLTWSLSSVASCGRNMRYVWFNERTMGWHSFTESHNTKQMPVAVVHNLPYPNKLLSIKRPDQTSSTWLQFLWLCQRFFTYQKLDWTSLENRQINLGFCIMHGVFLFYFSFPSYCLWPCVSVLLTA